MKADDIVRKIMWSQYSENKTLDIGCELILEFAEKYHKDKLNIHKNNKPKSVGTKKSFGEYWNELNDDQKEYFKNYIDRQRQNAIDEYKKN